MVSCALKNIEFKQYRVTDRHRAPDEIISEGNSIVYSYSRPVDQGGLNIDCFEDYAFLLSRLKTHPRVEIKNGLEVALTGCAENKITVTIRHDMDSDLAASVEMAKLEQRVGVSSSYFVLHTGPYYCYFDGRTVYRYEGMAQYYLSIQECGHEVGLHIDPYFFYRDHGIDGSEAVRTELDWLRSQGLNIQSTAPHNSAQIYGVESAAIFKGRARPSSIKTLPQFDSNAKWFEFNGKSSPMQVLDEKELGLIYEAGEDYVWNETIPRENSVITGGDKWNWSAYSDVELRKYLKTRGHYTTMEQMLGFLFDSAPGTLVTMHIHPEHYGYRTAPGEWPVYSKGEQAFA
jgi:hypothetical protein